MKCKYAVTFEFIEAKPETVRGEISARASQTVVHRAVMEAKKQKKNMNWSSMVVFVEKMDETEDSDEIQA